MGQGLFFSREQQSYLLHGLELLAPIELTATPPSEISLEETAGFGGSLQTPAPDADGEVGPLSVFVRYAPGADRAHVGQIAHESLGAATRFVALAGADFGATVDPDDEPGTEGSPSGAAGSAGLAGNGPAAAGSAGGEGTGEEPALHDGGGPPEATEAGGCACTTSTLHARFGASSWWWSIVLLFWTRRFGARALIRS